MSRLVILLLACLGFALNGCMVLDESLAISLECSTHDDCGDGQACFFGKCVDSGDSLTEVFIDLSPPAYSNYVPHIDTASPRDLSRGGAQTLVVESAIDAGFEVKSTSGRWREGTVRLSLKPSNGALALPSTELSYVLPVGDSAAHLAMRAGVYDVAFEPSSDFDSRPSLEWAAQTIANASTLALTYPDDSEMQRISGQINWSEYVPISGAAIQAMASAEGSGVASTIAETLADGTFEVVLPTPQSFVDLTVRPIAVAGSSPSLRFTNVATDAPVNALTNHSLETVSLDVIIRNEAGGLEPDTTVQFDGLLWEKDGSLATHSHTVRTDENGLAGAELIVGLYQITIIPPRASEAGILQAQLCLGASDQLDSPCMDSDVGDSLEVEVPDKARVTGVIMAADGTPVADARVAFSPVKAWPRRVETVTDDQGRYAVMLDPAAGPSIAYQLLIEPPVEAAAPLHRTLVNVGVDSFELGVTLPAATFVDGVVTNSLGEPVANVGVSFYSRRLSDDGSPWLIGYGDTNDFGEYVVALPGEMVK